MLACWVRALIEMFPRDIVRGLAAVAGAIVLLTVPVGHIAEVAAAPDQWETRVTPL